MSVDADALRQEADRVSAELLARAGRRVGRLTPDQQEAAAELARAVGRSVVDLLLEEARRDPNLASALAREQDGPPAAAAPVRPASGSRVFGTAGGV